MKTAASILALTAFAAMPAMAADPATIDWSKIPVKSETLFFPAQSSLRVAAQRQAPGRAGSPDRGCLRHLP